MRGQNIDLAVDAQDNDEFGQAQPANYIVWLLNTTSLCEAIMPDDCIEKHGPLGCYVVLDTASQQPPPPPLGSSPPADTGGSPGGSSSGAPLGIIIPVVVVGTLAAIACVGVLVWHTRRRKARYAAAADKANIADGTDSKQPHCGVGNGMPSYRDGSSEAPNDSGCSPYSAELGLGNGVMLGNARSKEGPKLVDIVTPFSPAQNGVRLDLQYGLDFHIDHDVERGAGAFGRVVEGSYGGRRVAVKLVHDANCMRAAAKAMQNFRQEVEVLSRCSHPNVVALLGACLTPPHVCLVMELMEQSLEELMHQRQARLPLAMVLQIAMDVASGLAYLHPTIVHRDLKPANILLDNNSTAKLTDFGLARLRSTVVATAHPEAGTAPYMAPECFTPDNYTITHKADIYSFAVLLWELLTGQVPWEGQTQLAIAYAITLQKVRLPLDALDEARCPPKLRKLIVECWDHDPQRRPSAADVVKQLALVQQALVLRSGDVAGSVDTAQSRGASTAVSKASKGSNGLVAAQVIATPAPAVPAAVLELPPVEPQQEVQQP